MALSVRTRFEIFKRDDFTCRYCGRRSPEVVLEIDHVLPLCEGGSDDEMNLLTSCWECNRGKSGIPLALIMTGEDPHDRAIELLERERQLSEYNRLIAHERQQREEKAWELWRYWQRARGLKAKKELNTVPRFEWGWLLRALTYCPLEQIRIFMDLALEKGLHRNLRYVGGCVRNWRYEYQANKDFGRDDVLPGRE
jgi:hypothetical protein